LREAICHALDEEIAMTISSHAVLPSTVMSVSGDASHTRSAAPHGPKNAQVSFDQMLADTTSSVTKTAAPVNPSVAQGNNIMFLSGDTVDKEGGTVSSSKHGDGRYERTSTEADGQRITDKTVTYADGTTRSVERSVTVNADGSKTIVKTGKDGKTTTIQESKAQNADGTFSISKQITHADGSVTEVSGMVSKSGGETEKVLTLTNAQGQTETLDRCTSHNGNITSRSTTGTGYNGEVIDYSSTWATYA
jgi:hypothetical protein